MTNRFAAPASQEGSLDDFLAQLVGKSVSVLIAGNHWLNGTLTSFNFEAIVVTTALRPVACSRGHVVSIAPAIIRELAARS